MKIKNIEINNFRGFTSLKMEDFGTINLLLGKNNCGKTSVLEALFLISGMSNPQGTLMVNASRDLHFRGGEDFRYIFHKLDFNNNPQIKASFSEKKHVRNLEIKPIYTNTLGAYNDLTKTKIEDFNDLELNTSENLRISGLTHEFSIEEEGIPLLNYTSSVYLEEGKLVYQVRKGYEENVQARIIRDYVNTNLLEEIIKAKQQEKIITILKHIDQRIQNIIVLSNGQVFFDLTTIEHLVPINIMGDGIKKILSLITTILYMKNGIVFIDEIENGLHFSAHKILWKAIIKIAKEQNVQLFITTHSIETIKYLDEVGKEKENLDFQEQIKSYVIVDLGNDIFKSYQYGFDAFNHVVEYGNEIR